MMLNVTFSTELSDAWCSFKKPRLDQQVWTYLSDGLQAAGELDLVDTMMHWFAIGSTFGDGAFTTSTAHTNTVDHVACFDRTKICNYPNGYRWWQVTDVEANNHRHSTHLAWPCSPACEPCLAWWVWEHGGGWTADGTASSGRGARSASRRTASYAIAPAYTYMPPCWLIWEEKETLVKSFLSAC